MSEAEVCPVCQGLGQVTYVDEEVGCQVDIPCWACSSTTECSPGQASSDAPWIGCPWPGASN